jgi:hypothetical protein
MRIQISIFMTLVGNLLAKDENIGASNIAFSITTSGTYYVKIVDKNKSFGSGTNYKISVGLDDDLDGYVSSTVGGTDCNDSDPNINPGVPENCTDGIDNNCNGYADSQDMIDTDGDGYMACGSPGDCNDNNPDINPGRTEVCDDIDNNCSTVVDEGCDDDNDNYCDKTMTVVGTPSTCTFGGNDCNDNNPNVNPSRSEVCNGIDDNCDGKMDYASTPGDLDNTCGTDTFCLDYYCNEGVGCASAPQHEGQQCAPTQYSPWGSCVFEGDPICDETGIQTRTVTTYTCVGGNCNSSSSTETRACSRETDGNNCGTKDCDYLDTTCRNYHDVAKYCVNGSCYSPPCDSYTNAPYGTQCGNWSSCSYSSCTGWTGSVYCTRTGGTKTAPACDGNGNCSSTITQSCADSSCSGGTKCSGGSCVSSSESCNGYDDDCDGSVDEGLSGDGQEPNNTKSSAKFLGNFSDCDAERAWYLTIYPSGDEDWFYYKAVDDICSLYPHITLTYIPAGVDYDLKVSFQCVSGSISSWSCNAGYACSDGGLNACCSDNGGNANEVVELNVDCSGSDDSLWVYIHVYPWSGWSCYTYRLGIVQ